MAKPVKETPVLFGRDAERFKAEAKRNEQARKSTHDHQRAEREERALNKFSFSL